MKTPVSYKLPLLGRKKYTRGEANVPERRHSHTFTQGYIMQWVGGRAKQVAYSTIAL